MAFTENQKFERKFARGYASQAIEYIARSLQYSKRAADKRLKDPKSLRVQSSNCQKWAVEAAIRSAECAFIAHPERRPASDVPTSKQIEMNIDEEKDMILINSTTQKEVKTGDEVTTFRGKKGILLSWTTNRVYVKTEGLLYTSEWFPSVIGCEVKE